MKKDPIDIVMIIVPVLLTGIANIIKTIHQDAILEKKADKYLDKKVDKYLDKKFKKEEAENK